MVAFTKSLVFHFAVLASIVVMTTAAPWPLHVRHPTHRIRTVGRRGIKVETFHPKPVFKVGLCTIHDATLFLTLVRTA